jgi:hypothetical protein
LASETEVLEWIVRLVAVGREKYTQLKSVENIHSRLIHMQATLEKETNRIEREYDSQ